jgi:FtsZ-binding cell division protein ZapB
MNLTSKQSLIAIVVLAVVCIFLGAQLFLGNKNYDDLKNKHGQLENDKKQVVTDKNLIVRDLENMRDSYDNLQTENSMIIAEIAAQRDRVDGLLTKVKNGNWALGRAKKEAETLRTIMKGYIATIDSVNQLNNTLTVENMAMKDMVEDVQGRNTLLEERQENMSEIIEVGRVLQCVEIDAMGVRILSSGRQRETSRADRTDMIKVCFSLLANRISEPGSKLLRLRITGPNEQVLLSGEEDGYSASRTIDYANERLDACVFYTDEGGGSGLEPGTYLVEILEEDVVIGSSTIDMR